MSPPNKEQLKQLRRAVKAARAARQALDDLEHAMSSSGFSEAMRELLEEEIVDIELSDRPLDKTTLEMLRNALYWAAP